MGNYWKIDVTSRSTSVYQPVVQPGLGLDGKLLGNFHLTLVLPWLISIFQLADMLPSKTEHVTNGNKAHTLKRNTRPYRAHGYWLGVHCAGYLISFRAATVEMSPTITLNNPSNLWEDIKNILRTLPNSVSHNIKRGLTDAHPTPGLHVLSFLFSTYCTYDHILLLVLSLWPLSTRMIQSYHITSRNRKQTSSTSNIDTNYANSVVLSSSSALPLMTVTPPATDRSH